MQGKSPKQYSDSARFAGYGIIGVIVCMIVATMLPAPMMNDPRPAGPAYNYWVPTEEDIIALDSLHDIVKETNTDLDTVRKSLDRCIDKLDAIYKERKSEYHGKEGRSEYGEYVPSDEHRMWITGEGDTIWE